MTFVKGTVELDLCVSPEFPTWSG